MKDIFSPPSGTSTTLGVVGVFFLLVAALSFTRGVQRMFEQTWELAPAERAQLGQRAAVDRRADAVPRPQRRPPCRAGAQPSRALARPCSTTPLSAVFLIWSGWVLSAKRIAWRDLVPFAVLGSALLAVYSVGASVYVPHLFSTYATRYGVIGAVFAMISALFCIMVVVVGSAAAGREIHDELERIRRGERPAEDEVRRQWAEITTETRSRWETLRAQVRARRRGRDPD